jgi:hypothetical protein
VSVQIENLSSLRRWHKLWVMFLHQLFFYLTILLLPTQLGLHLWPDWALVLGRRIDYLSPTLFLTDITIICTLLLWICFPHKKTVSATHLVLPKTVLLYIGIGIFVVCNILFSSSPIVVTVRWMKIIELVLFGYYIVKTKPPLTTTSLYLTVSMMYSSIIAIMQFILQHSIGGILWYVGERSFTLATPGIARINWCWIAGTNCVELLRPYATFPHPNVLAGFLSITICISIWRILTHRIEQKKIRLWYWMTIAISVIALGLTFSRGVWLISIIGILTLLGIVRKKSITHTILWIVLGLILCIATAFPYYLSLFKQSESVLIRDELSRAAFTMWKGYPLIGVGLNAFLITLPTVIPSRYLFFLQPPHNIYMLTLAELGLIGIGGICYFVYRLFLRLIHMPDKLPLIVFLIYGLLGTIDHYPITLQQGQLLTVVVLTLSFFSK